MSVIGLCPPPSLTTVSCIYFQILLANIILLSLSCLGLDYPVTKQTGDFIPPSGLIDSIPAPRDYTVAVEEFIRVFCPPKIRQDKV